MTIPVTATPTSQIVIGHITPREVFLSLDTDDTRTEHEAHLVDGTPAGRLIGWGAGIAPATHRYRTEAEARAAIRRVHRVRKEGT